LILKKLIVLLDGGAFHEILNIVFIRRKD